MIPTGPTARPLATFLAEKPRWRETSDPGRPRATGRRALLTVSVIAVALGLVFLGVTVWVGATDRVHLSGTPTCRAVARTGTSPSPDADVEGVCATLDGLTRAWDAGDAEAYGRGFHEHATYTAFTGTVYLGRDDITAGHRALFDGLLADTRLATRYLTIHLAGGGHAVVLARGDTYEGDQAPETVSKVQSFSLVRDARTGRWVVTAFHNTRRDPLMERIQFLVAPDTVPARERGR